MIYPTLFFKSPNEPAIPEIDTLHGILHDKEMAVIQSALRDHLKRKPHKGDLEKLDTEPSGYRQYKLLYKKKHIGTLELVVGRAGKNGFELKVEFKK